MEDDQPQQNPVSRRGRGALIQQALQSLRRQPGQASAPLQEQAVPPPIKISGAGLQKSIGSSSEAGESLSSRSMGGRGALIAQLLKQVSPPSTSGSFVTGATALAPEGDTPPIGRGRASLFEALKSRKVTGALKPSSEQSESSSQCSRTPSMTESFQQMNISKEEKEVISKQGTSGSRFSGSANWIHMRLEPNMAVFEYEVRFEPPVDARNLRFKLLNAHRDKIGSVKSFDGIKLWLPSRLPNEITLLHATQPFTEESITIKIIFKSKTSMDRCVQLYNVLFGRIMRILKLAKVGYNYYSPSGCTIIPQHKLEIWPGYITAAHFMEGGLMLMVDVSHRVLRTETCYDVMSDIFRAKKGNFKEAVSKVLIGSIVLTRYNNKSYRVDDILFEQNTMSTFTNSKGEEIRYVDYYKNAYDIHVKDPKQPLLLHKVTKKELKEKGNTKALCLIPELCYMTGLTDDMRGDFRVMKDIAQFTRITPDVRQASLRTFIKNVNDNPEARQTLADWGLSLEDNTIPIEGRTLAPETIYFKNKEVAGTDIADFSRDACRENVITPIDLMSQCWLVMFTYKDESRAIKFVDMMRQVTRSMGIRVGDPQVVRLPDDRTESYINSLKRYYHDKLQIAVVIFPTPREDRYSAVKRLACVDLSLPTQCINSRTLSQENKLRSVTQKIALQINCKVGGELWAVKIPMTGLMVCGIDVYHDPTRRGSSVVGFVASSNSSLTKWFSRTTFQNPGEEIVNGLKISMLEALRYYHKLHHSLPRTIIVYRDGVSDGQLKLVEDHEVPQLASIFLNFDSYEPKLSFVVVQKKLNTRIFAAMGGRKYDNPPPGSIVDGIITRRHWYDFFLVSQHVRQGTISPTYYIVVHDGGNLKVDNMQKLSYKLTHLYYNWPGTVRVPAPCQYAHKVAYLVGQNIRKDPSTELCDKLYFL